MRPFVLLLLPVALFAGQARFARLGDFDGQAEVQMQAADPWMPAERNLPLVEGAWLRTGASSRVEIEFDEGSAWRLGPQSQGEISDDSRLSTGQLITLLSLDHGTAYFTGEPKGKDSLSLAIPGAQLILTRGARLRLSAQDGRSEIAIIEGSVKVSSPDVEVVLGEGQTIRVDASSGGKLAFIHKVESMDLDQWSEGRDRALFAPPSANRVPEHYGVADLDGAGEWLHTDDLGDVWKPKTASDWAPFQNGRWRWYDSTGYTWVAGDAWGWLPYHYGRWARRANVGWVWAPGDSQVFKPGEVYWLRGAALAGWGPLAPGEEWVPASAPQQFSAANTTYATWAQDARAIDPAGFTARPKEPLAAAAFALALPSPAFAASRLDAVRPPTRAGSTAVNPVVPGVTYEPQDPPTPDTADDRPPAVVTNPDSASAPVVVANAPDLVPLAPPPAPALPTAILYAAPIYTGIVIMNPPESTTTTPPAKPRNPSPSTPTAAPAPAAPTPVSTAPTLPRTHPPDPSPEPPHPDRKDQ